MKIEMGSVTILYGWYKYKNIPLNKITKTQIAKQLSEGLKFGQFHYSLNGYTDSIGWWVIQE